MRYIILGTLHNYGLFTVAKVESLVEKAFTDADFEGYTQCEAKPEIAL